QQDPTDAKSVRDALLNPSDGPFQVQWVKRFSEGLEQLSMERMQTTDGTAAIVVDLFLPDSRGIETFDQLFHAARQIPILLLSPLQHEPLARLAVQRVAHDYLLKERLDAHVLQKA